ncbi:hypothetical protein B0H17DRAFT_1211549 [Mycena rosella]|uniref:Uncharacterized protein n=1 Tax=Mycena rosella TaxID=1033263 RepID=A0AAD7G677_MYCRO|nr:hypothetical protein B0H17DRAFT_1211549 [Mycena rosella]
MFPAELLRTPQACAVASVGSAFLNFFSRPPLISFNRTALSFDLATLYACWYAHFAASGTLQHLFIHTNELRGIDSDSTPVTPPSRGSSPPTTILARHSSPLLAEVAVTSFERAPHPDRLPHVGHSAPGRRRIPGGLRYAL